MKARNDEYNKRLIKKQIAKKIIDYFIDVDYKKISVFQQIKQLIQLMQWELQKQSKKKLQLQNPEYLEKQRFVVPVMEMLCAVVDQLFHFGLIRLSREIQLL